MTPHDLIKLALKKCGALALGQTMAGEDFNDAFAELNLMLSEWAQGSGLVYCTQTVGVVSTGVLSYGVGPGQSFNIAQRPARVMGAFCRQLVQPEATQGVVTVGSPNPDYPISVLNARDDYNQIVTKGMTTLPSYVWYDPQWPTGLAYFWPVPLPAIYELYLTMLFPLTQLTSQTSTLSLPPEYYAAVLYNLAVRLGESYSLPPKPVTVALAKSSLNTLRKANTRIARLQMPRTLVRSGVYNPYSDQVR